MLNKKLLFILCLFILVFSFFSCSEKFVTNKLTMSITGDGSGIIDPEIGVHVYNENTEIVITAFPNLDSKFDMWIGDVTDTYNSTTTVVMDSDKEITAVFSIKEYSVSGYIKNYNNQGISNVKISFHDYYEPVYTDENGFWEKTDIVGEIEITISKDNHTFNPKHLNLDKETFNINILGGIIGEKNTFKKNNVSFDMVLAPSLEFPTGYDDNYYNEVEKSFFISEFIVHYDLWYKIRIWAENNGYNFEKKGFEGAGYTPINSGVPTNLRKNHPVTGVSWYDAIIWCNALSEFFGYEPVYYYNNRIFKDSTDENIRDYIIAKNNNGFRLPTNSEWELSARYKGDNNNNSVEYPENSSIFWTPGNYVSGADYDYNHIEEIEKVAWFLNNSNLETKNVGLKPSEGNYLGLYDMSGLVWEWVFDKYSDNDYNYRIIRGGSLCSSRKSLIVSNVDKFVPSGRYVNKFGFRISKTLY